MKHIGKLLSLIILIGIQSSLTAQVNFNQSNLPIILINTNGEDIPDEPKIMADMKIIYNGPDKENYLTDSNFHYDNTSERYQAATFPKSLIFW